MRPVVLKRGVSVPYPKVRVWRPFAGFKQLYVVVVAVLARVDLVLVFVEGFEPAVQVAVFEQVVLVYGTA